MSGLFDEGSFEAYFYSLNFYVMKRNIGYADRFIRAMVALVFAALIVSGAVTGVVSLVMGIVGGLFLLTAVSGWCPLYAGIGISTCSEDHHSVH